MISRICDYIKDLMPFDATKIIIGRSNYNVVDFDSDIIVVDTLLISPIGKSDKYDGIEEIMTYSTSYKINATIDFFGINSLENATKFINLQSSQKALELQNSLNIGVFHSKNLKNLMEQVGTNYFQRYQIELIAMVSVSTDVDTLRIDDAIVDIVSDGTIQDLSGIEINQSL